MNKQNWQSIILFFLLALLLAACSGGETATEGETAPEADTTQEEPAAAVEEEAEAEPETAVVEEPVTISFWHAYNEVEAALLDETLIPQFEAANPNVKVESVNIPYDQFRRKLLTAIAGGTAPDLIRADIIWVPEFADMGALVALDELMPDFADYQEAVFPGPLATNYLNGHYYGFPLDTNTRVLVYNKDMFAAAGIENPPATMDEFMTACEQIKALGEDKYCFADGGTYAWAVNPWIWSFGGDVTDSEATVATGYLDSGETQAAYEFVKNLVDEGYMHPGILGDGVDAWGGFGNDEIAMILEGPWFTPFFSGSFPDKEYGFALMPAGPGGSVSVVGGEDIIMFKQSQNQEAAADFMRFMLSEETQLALVEVGQMPVIKSALDTDVIQNHEYFGIFLQQLETAKARTPHPQWTKIEETYTNAGGALLLGEMSFADAFGEAATNIDGLLPLEEQ